MVRHEAVGVIKFANGLVAVGCPDVITEDADRTCAGAEVEVHIFGGQHRDQTCAVEN